MSIYKTSSTFLGVMVFSPIYYDYTAFIIQKVQKPTLLHEFSTKSFKLSNGLVFN
jgi:hypothetical protein